MAEFTVIDAAKAPRRPTTPANLRLRMQEYEGYVVGVKKGQAGRLTPSAGETLRSLALRVSLAGNRAGKDVTAWTADGSVYFTVA